MKIGIDYSAVAGERTGVGQYTYDLVHALLRIDRKNSYTLYPVFYNMLFSIPRKRDLPVSGNFEVAWKRLPYVFLKFWWLPFMPSSLKEYMLGDVDVVHSTTFSSPRLKDKRKRLVVTIHDITVITHPECHQRRNICYSLRGIKHAVKYADAIIAISNHTKQDLINYLKAPEDMITVTHLSAGPNYHPIVDLEILSAVRDKYNLPPKYVLFLGSLEPRKNVQTLIKAYSKLPERFQKEFSLVVAGAKGWLNSKIKKTVEDLSISDRVSFPGYIAEEDISAVYSQATVFVYPSLYEGFGLPVLEAMSCGTPVITSNTSSMPEVAGNAARFISPTNVDELGDILEYVLENEDVRQEMRLAGLKRAKQFSWEKCASETLEVYRKVIESSRG